MDRNAAKRLGRCTRTPDVTWCPLPRRMRELLVTIAASETGCRTSESPPATSHMSEGNSVFSEDGCRPTLPG
jgi:hypothetical protein